MGYELIEHAADLGIVVTSRDMPTLFSDAALALAHITGANASEQDSLIEVSVSGIDRLDLLVRWLQELLYLIMAKSLRICSIEVQNLTDTSLTARIRGRSERTPLEREIKAVTYHHLEILHIDNGFEATIIFDI